MLRKSCCAYVVMVLLGLLVPVTVRADDIRTPSGDGGSPGAPGKKGVIADAGKLEDFKGKKLDLKEKGEATFTLSFPGDKDVFIHVTSEKKSDVNLFVYDAAKKEVAKDDSPGPECTVAFKLKSPQKLTLVVRNLGPGANSSMVQAGMGKAH
jgi:hypothetical protein